MYQQTQENAKGGKKADLALAGAILLIMILMNRFSSAISAFIPPAAVQAVMFAGLATLCFVIFRRRLCTYRYTVILERDESVKEDKEIREHEELPPGTLIAQQMIGDKPRVSEIVLPDEMLRIALRESHPAGFQERPKAVRITGRPAKTAHCLYYRRGGRLMRLEFHPDNALISHLPEKLRNLSN